MRLDEAIKILKNNNYILEDKYMDDMDSELDDIIKNSSVKDDAESEKPIKKEISLKKPQKKPEKENFMGVKVGDIFDAYWGYSMTLHSFYQITSIKGQKVTIIELEKKWVDGDGFQGHVMPIYPKFRLQRNSAHFRPFYNSYPLRQRNISRQRTRLSIAVL